MKKTPRDIIILHKRSKNYHHMLYCFRDMGHDRSNCYFSFWATYCPFTPLTVPESEFKKMKKNPGNIIILQMCTKNYD